VLELVEDAGVEVEVAAKTHGVAMSAAAIEIAAITVSGAVLVFIPASTKSECSGYILNFRDGS
jgi:hypothetical protein